MKFVQSRSSSNARLEVLEQLLLCESEKGVEFETKARVLNNIATARSRGIARMLRQSYREPQTSSMRKTSYPSPSLSMPTSCVE